MRTLLTKNGIHIPKGEDVSVINTITGETDSVKLEDELDFDIGVLQSYCDY